MDWFEKLTGFRETGYEETRAKLAARKGGYDGADAKAVSARSLKMNAVTE